MNIQEAIKSNKKFKRPKHLYWMTKVLIDNYVFIVDDLLADDWEVQEERILVSKSELLHLYSLGLEQGYFNSRGSPHKLDTRVENYLKTLGFK